MHHMIEVSKITQNPRALRKVNLNHPLVKPLVDDIAKNGIQEPVILTGQDMLVDGLVRYEAAKALGITHIPCVYR